MFTQTCKTAALLILAAAVSGCVYSPYPPTPVYYTPPQHETARPPAQLPPTAITGNLSGNTVIVPPPFANKEAVASAATKGADATFEEPAALKAPTLESPAPSPMLAAPEVAAEGAAADVAAAETADMFAILGEVGEIIIELAPLGL